MARRKKEWWQERRPLNCPPLVHAVVPWRKEGNYRREDAVKVYKRESAADAFARKRTSENLVVRAFHAETGEHILYVDPRCVRRKRR